MLIFAELISGSTPDSFTFYAGMGGCVTAYNDGECPVDDRWHCANQYGCEMPGCTQIDYTHAQYNNPGYPFAVTFSSMTDCEQWCNPVAFFLFYTNINTVLYRDFMCINK